MANIIITVSSGEEEDLLEDMRFDIDGRACFICLLLFYLMFVEVCGNQFVDDELDIPVPMNGEYFIT